MVDSKCDIHPALNRLVTDIVTDFRNNTRPSNNYVDRRLDLINEMGVGVLADVDERLYVALKNVEMKDENLHHRLTGWAHVLKARSSQV